MIANRRACKSEILALSECSLNRYDRNIENIYRKRYAKLSRFSRLFSYFLCEILLNEWTDSNSQDTCDGNARLKSFRRLCYVDSKERW